jgi:thioredoxin reductase (NADPH)
MHDIVVIGAGPAGMTAAIYARRAARSVLVLEAVSCGGQILNTPDIENYPVEAHISGFDFSQKLHAQAEGLGAEFIFEKAVEVRDLGEVKEIVTTKNSYQARAVILATGSENRKLGLEDEARLTGRGVSYCATCDGPFFEGLPVYVVGGGDAAVEEAIYLTKFASKVTIIHRRDALRAAKSIQEKAFSNSKIAFKWNTTVESMSGDGYLQSMILKNVADGSRVRISGRFGLFVFVGLKPNTAVFEGLLDMERGFIATDSEMRTSVPGVFAAGDVRVKNLRQVVTAVSDGAVAAVAAEKYIESAGQA